MHLLNYGALTPAVANIIINWFSILPRLANKLVQLSEDYMFIDCTKNYQNSFVGFI